MHAAPALAATLLLAVAAAASPLPQASRTTTSAAAPAASATPAAGGAAGLEAILGGGAATLPAPCAELYTKQLLPFIGDAECEFSKFMSGTVSNATVIEPQLTKMCAKGCADKASAALKSVSGVAECSNNVVFASGVLAAFYHYNLACMKSPKNTFCFVDQSKALDAAKLPANATADKWPKAELCSECTQRQVKLTGTLDSFSRLAMDVSSRPNPAANTTLLAAQCGQPWLDAAAKIDVPLTVAMLSKDAGSGNNSTAGAGGAVTKPSAAGKTHVGVGAAVAAVVGAMAMLL